VEKRNGRSRFPSPAENRVVIPRPAKSFYLEGLHYFKLIEKEGQPLSGYEKKQELERMRDEGGKAARSEVPAARETSHGAVYSLLPRLADDFDLKLAVEDERCWTITGRPKYQGSKSPCT
jgi:hypothetical protein